MVCVYLSFGFNVELWCYLIVVLDELCVCFGVLVVLLVYCIKLVGFDGVDFVNFVVGLDMDLLL